MEPQAPQGQLGVPGDCGMSGLLVPSPQSEAVTQEMEVLSLQPTQNLPPLNERKNGEVIIQSLNSMTEDSLKGNTLFPCG